MVQGFLTHLTVYLTSLTLVLCIVRVMKHASCVDKHGLHHQAHQLVLHSPNLQISTPSADPEHRQH